jgi:hypothetical protein
MAEIAAFLIAILLAGLLAFLIYRAARTYDAGAHATFITTKGGDFYGALRAPITLWDPTIKVLRDRHAPDITIMTTDAGGTEYFEKTLVNRRTGEISLRVHTCCPRPFVARTADKRQLVIKAKVSFQLDVDRIQIPTQMEAFGVTLGARIQNLFDNCIGELEDQDVFARQREIEAKVLGELLALEGQADPNAGAGMPLGIKIYEAMFAYEPFAKELNKDPSNGPMAYDNEHLDDLVDMLEKANPQTVETLLRMLELQTRQNIVSMLCKSGGLVAFTASELGLSDRTIERASNGMNIMKPPAHPLVATISPNGGDPAVAAAPPQPQASPAQAYYNLGAPKGKQPAGSN